MTAETPEVIARYRSDENAWLTANPTPELQSRETFGRAQASLFKKLLQDARPVLQRHDFRTGAIHRTRHYFQADGNAAHPLEYSELFDALIKEWRADWHEQLPFFFVEMNNMNLSKPTNPVEPRQLTIIREQQHAGLPTRLDQAIAKALEDDTFAD